MRRVLLSLALLTLYPAIAVGVDFTSVGAGGGGWLEAGTFHPTNPNTILIGADIAGVYRTDDFGQNWRVWNAGLPTGDELLQQYVDDMEGIVYARKTYFFAATHGGIFRATDAGPWELLTTPASYWYKSTSNYRADAIPFSCLDYDGSSIMVAGAGRSRWAALSYETSSYPGLPDASYEGGAFDGQYTVWKCSLDDPDSWDPDTDSTFGAARDITVVNLNTLQCIAVATTNGIFVKRGNEGWFEVGTGLEDYLRCWSLHLTKRGTLYAAFERISDTDTQYASGVYKIFDIKTATDGSSFSYVGDGTLLPPDNATMWSIGCKTTQGPHFCFLTVVDGKGTNKLATPDVLYLGDRGPYNGLFRGYAPYSATTSGYWQHLVYTLDWANEVYTCDYRVEGSPPVVTPLDLGWQTFWGVDVLFQPLIYPKDPAYIALQFNCRMHVSDTAGDTWLQRYTIPAGAGWISRGYNEMGVAGLDFTSDGMIVEGVYDVGAYRQIQDAPPAFELFGPTLNPNATAISNEVWTRPASSVHVRANYDGSGEDAIFFNWGGCNTTQASKLMCLHQGEWTNVSANVPDLGECIFGDFAFCGDDTLFLIYRKYVPGTTLGIVTSLMQEQGVLRLTHDHQQDSWVCQKINDGLYNSDAKFNQPGRALLFNEPSRRIFLASHYAVVTDATNSAISINGGLLMLDGPDDTSWTVVYGASDETSPYRDFRCLAQSVDGGVIYAGTRGRSNAGRGTLLRCDDPVGASQTWTELANTSVSDMPFGFAIPFWASTAYGYGIDWDLYRANWTLTQIDALAVDPNDANTVYVGMACYGFMPQEGLWVYNSTTGWAELSSSAPFKGMGVNKLAIHAPTGRMAIGTNGQELFITNVSSMAKAAAGSRMGFWLSARQIGVGGEQATIELRLGVAAKLKVKLFDLRGRLVRRLETERLPAGVNRLLWDGRSDRGAPAASGLYFARVQAGDQETKCRVVLIK